MAYYDIVSMVADEIMGILDELIEDEFKRFKYYLKELVLEGFKPIPRGQLQDKNVTDVVEMMKIFYSYKMEEITMEIFKKMGQTDRIQRLKSNLEKVKDSCPVEPWTRLDSFQMKGVRTAEPKTREDFLQYSCRLTLDPKTAHKVLRLSEGNTKVIRVEQNQPYPDHPERFDYWFQVLCREGLSGRCYWEAEWRGNYIVPIAVSYKEIGRKGRGEDSHLGYNNQSWSLRCSHTSYSFWHNNESTEIPVPSSSRIGVYLDHQAGTLSFYSVSYTMTLLHRVQTTFTRPLYPAFGFNPGCSIKLCDLR